MTRTPTVTPPHAVLLALLAFTLVSIAPRVTAQEPASQTPAKKKVLMVWGGWAGHQPKQTVDVFAPWLAEQGFDVEISNTLDSYLDVEKMKGLALVVQAVTMGQITPQQEKGLLDAIRGGVGLAGWHGGLGDAFRSNTEFEFMVGGSFAAHPGGSIEYNVHIAKRDDPITKGLQDFRMRSEQYYMLMDPSVEVLVTTTFSGKVVPAIEGVVMPVAWKKLYGKGRVFNSTLGHSAGTSTCRKRARSCSAGCCGPRASPAPAGIRRRPTPTADAPLVPDSHFRSSAGCRRGDPRPEDASWMSSSRSAG